MLGEVLETVSAGNCGDCSVCVLLSFNRNGKRLLGFSDIVSALSPSEMYILRECEASVMVGFWQYGCFLIFHQSLLLWGQNFSRCKWSLEDTHTALMMLSILIWGSFRYFYFLLKLQWPLLLMSILSRKHIAWRFNLQFFLLKQTMFFCVQVGWIWEGCFLVSGVFQAVRNVSRGWLLTGGMAHTWLVQILNKLNWIASRKLFKEASCTIRVSFLYLIGWLVAIEELHSFRSTIFKQVCVGLFPSWPLTFDIGWI